MSLRAAMASYPWFRGGYTLEWFTTCCLSFSMVLGLVGFGVILGVPLRLLSDSILHGHVARFPDGLMVHAPASNRTLSMGGTEGMGGSPGGDGNGRVVLQGLWELAAVDYAPITTSPAFPGLLAITYFFCSVMPYWVLDVLSHRRYKCQPEVEARSWLNTLKAIGYVLQITVGLQVPGVIHQSVTQGPWPYYVGPHVCIANCSYMALPETAPSLGEVVLHLLMCLWLMDLLYFIYHRHHHRGTWRYANLLYKHVHSVHHEWRSPFAWCTQYLHPVELAATGIFSIVSPVLVGAHPLTMWVWLCVSIQLSVDAHSGYEFPISLSSLLPSALGPLKLGGAKHHDDHHKYLRFNYQPFLTYRPRVVTGGPAPTSPELTGNSLHSETPAGITIVRSRYLDDTMGTTYNDDNKKSKRARKSE